MAPPGARGWGFVAVLTSARTINRLVKNGMMSRFEFDESADGPPLGAVKISDVPASAPSTAPASVVSQGAVLPERGGSRDDLAMVEDLLDRCWREVDASSLNVKLADLVRLLEFKNKLRSAADAEQTFWTMINDIRREELRSYGVIEPSPDSTVQTEDDESEIKTASA